MADNGRVRGTRFNLQRYVAKETAASLVINVLVSTVPSLWFGISAANGTLRPVREVAVGLTPQFFMAALMSALVPSLLTCWRQTRGRLGLSPLVPRLRPDRAAVIALGLAIASTTAVLALIHVVVAPLAGSGLGAGATLALGDAQAALAAATVTPAAIFLLFGRARHGQA